jgi:hypothetical protein
MDGSLHFAVTVPMPEQKWEEASVSHQSFCIALSLLCVTASIVCGEETQPVVELIDLAGRPQRPFRQSDRKATVLFFVLPDCPISNASAPEIQRIVTEYAKKDVASFIVYVDPELSAEDARKHAKEFGFAGSVLCDTRLKLVKQAGATIAPESVVLSPDGEIRYRGRINDLYVDFGKRRAQPSQHDLRDALEAVLAGRPVTRTRTQAIGCPIAQP